jgi:hypothetical protein
MCVMCHAWLTEVSNPPGRSSEIGPLAACPDQCNLGLFADGQDICYFQPAGNFLVEPGSRHCTLGQPAPQPSTLWVMVALAALA